MCDRESVLLLLYSGQFAKRLLAIFAFPMNSKWCSMTYYYYVMCCVILCVWQLIFAHIPPLFWVFKNTFLQGANGIFNDFKSIVFKCTHFNVETACELLLWCQNILHLLKCFSLSVNGKIPRKISSYAVSYSFFAVLTLCFRWSETLSPKCPQLFQISTICIRSSLFIFRNSP